MRPPKNDGFNWSFETEKILRPPKNKDLSWRFRADESIYILVQKDDEADVPPCERLGGCIHKQKCSESEIACADFAAYLGSPAPKRKLVERDDYGRYPSAKLYDLVFNRCDVTVTTKAGKKKDCGRVLKKNDMGNMCCPKHDAAALKELVA